MADPKIRYDIAADVSGEEDVRDLVRRLDELGNSLDKDVAARAKSAGEALRTALAAKGGRDQLTEFAASVKEAERALRDAQASLGSYQKAITGIGPPTREAVAQEQRLQQTVAQAKAVLDGKRQSLLAAEASLARFGSASTSAGAANKNLAVTVESVRHTVAQLDPSYRSVAQAAQASGRQQVQANKAVKQSVGDVGQQIASLRNALAGIAGINIGASMLRDAVATADAMNSLKARISLVAEEGEHLEGAWQGVQDVALRTHSSLEGTGTLFQRLAQAGISAGQSTEVAIQQALGLTETINQAIQVSGASVASADAATTQLIQGLQSGVLRGEEFNSIMEQSPRLAKAMADGLGVTTGELRKLAGEGRLTTEVVTNAIKSQGETIRSEFEKLPLTVSGALQDLNTSWSVYIGKANEATGASATIAKAVNLLANNLDTVANSLFSIGKAFAAYKALRMAQNFWEMAKDAAAAAAANTNVATTAATAAAGNARVAVTAAQAAGAQRGMAASGAQVAASNRAVAATGMQAAAAHTAVATQAGLAARAGAAVNTSVAAVTQGVRGLVGILGALKTFGAVAILTNLPEIGRWIADTAAGLTGLKKQIKEAEEAMAHEAVRAKAAADFMREYNLAMQEVSDKSAGVSKAARGMADAFEAARKNGKTLKESLDEIQKTLDTSNYQSLHDFDMALRTLQRTGQITADDVSARWKAILNGQAFQVDSAQGIATVAKVFEDLQRTGAASAKTVEDAWAKALKSEDLALFEVRAKQAFMEGEISAQQLQAALDQGLRESINRAGLDFEVISGGMSIAASRSINDLELLIGNLGRLKEQGVDTGLALSASISKAINSADSEAAINTLILQIRRVKGELGEKVADGFLEQAAKKMQELKNASDKLKGGINSLNEAMSTLGVKSREELQSISKQAQEAYQTIKTAGQQEGESYLVWQQRKREAAEAMIKKMLEANRGIADGAIKTKAAVEGVRLEIDELGKATVKTADKTSSATDRMASDWEKVGDAARRARDEARKGSGSGGDDPNVALGLSRGAGTGVIDHNARRNVKSKIGRAEPQRADLSFHFEAITARDKGKLHELSDAQLEGFIKMAKQHQQAYAAGASYNAFSFDGARAVRKEVAAARDMEQELKRRRDAEHAAASAKADAEIAAMQFSQAQGQQQQQPAQQRTYQINLDGYGSINTDQSGANAVEAFMKALERGKAATGRRL